MAEMHYKERDRLLFSVFLTVVLHAVVFLLFQLLVTRIPPMPEYSGPLFVELADADSTVTDAAPAVPEEPVAETPLTVEEPVPDEPPVEEPEAVLPEPIEPGQDTVLIQAPTKPPIATATAARGGTRKPTPTVSRIMRSVTGRYTASTTRQQQSTGIISTPPDKTAAVVPTEESALQHMGELDKALGSTASAKPQTTGKTITGSSAQGKTGSSSSGGTTALIKWDVEEAKRDLEENPNPVLPDLRGMDASLLTVELFFAVQPQGFLSNIRIKKSSGYTAVDNAVRDALAKYKFKPITGDKIVTGTVTFEIKTR